MGAAIQSDLSEWKAARMMTALREGRTLRTFGVNTRLEAYFEAHSEYAREARPLIEANNEAARRHKGQHLRDRTHCKHGHSLADAYISRQRGGYIKRDCRVCWGIRQKKPGIIKPEIAKKVEALLRKGIPIRAFTKGGQGYLVQRKTFTRFRLENPKRTVFAKSKERG